MINQHKPIGTDTEELLQEVEKLERYVNQYISRSVNIQHALGVPGTRHLVSCFEAADRIRSKSGTSTTHLRD